MALILTIMVVFIVLVASEFGWRKRWLRNEVGRKFVHITVGSFVAFWPFFLSWNQIRFLSLAFLAVVIISSRLKIFHAINSVQRPTYGEIFFAISVGLLTFITHSKAIYAASILQMSFADGFAAIVGTHYGKTTSYRIFGHMKSIVGSMAFLVTSMAIFVIFNMLHADALPLLLIPLVASIAAAIENLAIMGLDNILVPLFVALVLTNIT